METSLSSCACTCTRVGAQILSLARAAGGLAGGFEGAGATAKEEGKRPDPWLWQERPRGAATGEGGRRVSPLEGTADRDLPAELRRAGLAVARLGERRHDDRVSWFGFGFGLGLGLGCPNLALT